MTRHIKYLISLLLIFNLAVHGDVICSPNTNAHYHHVSYAALTQNTSSYTLSKIYNYHAAPLPAKVLAITAHVYSILSDTHSTQTFNLIKSHIALYQTINLTTAQHTFLTTKITSGNYYSCLYIA